MPELISGTYFGGEASNLGKVKPLAAKDWRTLCREVFGQSVLLNTTRLQYAALAKADRDKVKRTPFFVPCSLKPGITERRLENVEACDLVAIDIDDAHDAAPFVANPELLRSALSPHPFLMYTTASSTEAAPRARIVVSAHRIPPEGYKDAVKYIASRLGLKAVTPESLTCCQAMFLPVLFAGEDEAIHSPLLIVEEEGEPVTTDVSPGGVVSVSPRKTGAVASGDPLDFLTPRMSNITLAEVQNALGFISPDIGYAAWLSVAAALRHQFSGSSEEDHAAFEAFDKWSSGGSKYTGQEETQAKWKSLVPNPTSRAPVTLRSLFHLAVEGGMSPIVLTQKTFRSVLAWIQGDHSSAELMREGMKLIASAPLLDPLERLVLLKHLGKSLTALGMGVSLADLKTKLKKLEARLGFDPDAKVAPLPDSQLPPWARGMTYVASENEFFVRASGRQFAPNVLDSMYGVRLMGVGEKEPGDSGKPATRPQDFLLNILRIPRVDGYRYDPANPHEVYLLDAGKRYLNTYRPLYPEADPALAAEAEDVISTHLDKLIVEPENRSLFLDWCCCLVQQPGKKIRWAPLLQGAQGCGKTVFAEMMRQVLGPTNVKLVDGATLFDKFTGWSSGSQLACVEEIRVIGTARHQVMNMLKPRISNDRITVRRMNTEAVEEPNTTNYLLLTNHQDAIAPSEDERRYFVLFSALQTREQVQAIPAAYYKKVYDVVFNKAAGVRHFLENRKISAAFDADGHAPVTDYLLQMLGASASPLAAAIREALEDGDHPLVQPDLVSLKSLHSLLETQRGIGFFSDQGLSAVLREMGFVSNARIRLGNDKTSQTRHTLWTHLTKFKGDAQDAARSRLNGSTLDERGALLSL
jgi:hypothetical protein